MISPCDLSVDRGELPHLLDFRGEAPGARERAPARIVDDVIREQRSGQLRRELLPRRWVRREQPHERLHRDAVVEVALLEAVLPADRLLYPGSGPAACGAHVVAQLLPARRNLNAVAVAR